MKFEEAYRKLENISAEMEKSDLPLEKAVALYTEAAELVDVCKKEIENARLAVEKIENS